MDSTPTPAASVKAGTVAAAEPAGIRAADVTEPGFYWYRGRSGRTAVVHAERDPHTPAMPVYFAFPGDSDDHVATSLHGHLIGPLPDPWLAPEYQPGALWSDRDGHARICGVVPTEGGAYAVLLRTRGQHGPRKRRPFLFPVASLARGDDGWRPEPEPNRRPV